MKHEKDSIVSMQYSNNADSRYEIGRCHQIDFYTGDMGTSVVMETHFFRKQSLGGRKYWFEISRFQQI